MLKTVELRSIKNGNYENLHVNRSILAQMRGASVSKTFYFFHLLRSSHVLNLTI